MEKTAITSLAWIPKGVASKDPSFRNAASYLPHELRGAHLSISSSSGNHLQPELQPEDNEELTLEATKRKTKATLVNAKRRKKAKKLTKKRAPSFEEFDDNECALPNEQFFQAFSSDADAILSDPYLNNGNYDTDDEEANKILDSDMLFVAASVESDMAFLEVYVYDESRGSLYIHHDIMVGGSPLCLQRLSAGDSLRNLVAMGSFSHSIDIWNLDVLDDLEPILRLGQSEEAETSNQKAIDDSHTGPVMCLDLANNGPHLPSLLSGSADKSVKLWDVNAESCIRTYNHHTDKVQAVKWHPVETRIALTASFDGSAVLCDVRQSGEVKLPVCLLPADVEAVLWNPQDPAQFLATTEDGKVTCYDTRRLKAKSNVQRRKPNWLWSFGAHNKPVTGLSMGPQVPNMMVTSSIDGIAKLWDVSQLDSDGHPTLVSRKPLKAGPLYDCQVNPDLGTLLAFAGSCVALWDVSSDANAMEAFGFLSHASSTNDFDAKEPPVGDNRAAAD